MLARWSLAVAVTLSTGGAAAQPVVDDFGNGNFTHDPPWSGDVDRFVVVASDTLNWLRSAGLPENDTLYLSTSSSVAAGYWRFRFRHEVNLSNFNGSRIYLVASSPNLAGEVQGYYVQFGTNNVNRVELWRQDGAPNDRTRLGESGPIMPGNENVVTVEVTRDELDRWTVWADGDPVIFNVTDGTYSTSTAIGVWVKHNPTGRDRFYWTDFAADPDPGDLTPPFPIAVGTAENGGALMVQFTEPLDPETVTSDAFWVEPGAGVPIDATLTHVSSVVRLEYEPPLAQGPYTLTVTGVADLAGNVQFGAKLDFDVIHHTEPPTLTGAIAIDGSTVRVFFDGPVLGCDPALYAITPEVGPPVDVDCLEPDRYELLLGAPMSGQQIYVVTATNVVDLAGNVQLETSARFFYGEFDVPVPRDVVINEIMFAPADVHSNEYVEIYNRTEDRIFDLSRLRFANATSPHRVIEDQPVPLAPGEYVVLVRNPDAFEALWPGVPYSHVTGFPALLNGGDTPQVLLDDGTVLDAVPYRPSWGGAGVALERRDPDGPGFTPANWGNSQHPIGGTPGELNSIFEPDQLPPIPLQAIPSNDGLTLVVLFDEPLNAETVSPAAFSFTNGPTVIEAAYFEDEAFRVALSLSPALDPGGHVLLVDGVEDWVGNATDDFIAFAFEPDLEPPVVVDVRPLDAFTVLVRFDEAVDPETAAEPGNYDVSGGIGRPASVVHTPASPDRVQLHLAVSLEGPHFYTLTVSNVEDIHGNAMSPAELVFFYGTPEPAAPGEFVISEVMYAPADLHSNEYVELYNITEKVFDLAEYTLSDQNATVPLTDSPYLLAPGEYAVLVRNPQAFEERFPGVGYIAVAGFPVLLNGGDAVVVHYVGASEPVTVDSVFYRPAWGGQGVALERRNPGGPSHSPMNWASSLDPAGGTPGAPNSVAPDTFAPNPLLVEVAPTGISLVVYFDEPLDPVTVVPASFSLSTIGAPAEATYEQDATSFVAALGLASSLAAGTYTLTVDGVADLLGNTTRNAEIGFTWEPDVTPPVIAAVFALDSTTVRVRFSKVVDPISASVPANYRISGGVGEPQEVAFAPQGHPDEVDLSLGIGLGEGVLYELTVAGVADLAGNMQPGTTALFLLGHGDVPEPGDVAVNEIMFREADGGTEYVEVRNVTEKIFDLSAFTLSDEGSPRSITADPVLLPPNAYVALARDAAALRRHFGDDGEVLQMPNLPSLRQSGDAVVLRFDDVVVDSLYYSPSWHRPELRDTRGVALERLDPSLPTNDPGNWTSSLDPRGGTPGRTNSVSISPGEAPGTPGISVSPSPFDAQSGTVIRYRLAADAGVVRIRVFDGAGRLVRSLEDARLAGRTVEGEVIWNGRNDRGEPLRVGIYVVLLEAVDVAGGTVEAYRAPVVLARAF